MINLNLTGLKNLAAEIVLHNIKDYEDTYFRYLKFKKPSDKKVLKQLEEWFYSDRFKLYCDIHPDFIMKAIERDIKMKILTNKEWQVLKKNFKLMEEANRAQAADYKKLKSKYDDLKKYIEELKIISGYYEWLNDPSNDIIFPNTDERGLSASDAHGISDF